MYVAYQTWQNPSWMSGPDGLPTYNKRVYGHGETPEDAIFDATHFEKNGETWAYGSGSGAPNASDLSVCRESELDGGK